MNDHRIGFAFRLGISLMAAAGLVVAHGCSSTGPVLTHDGTGGDEATGAGGAHGGTGGAIVGGTGGAHDGTGGAIVVPACPAALPAAHASCDAAANGQTCYYEDCAGAGRSTASCSGGQWNVITGPCTTVSCLGVTCQPGEICLESLGGAQIGSCFPNNCHGGPITCSCAGSCGGQCDTTGSVNGGVVIRCNTCPSGTCP